MLLTGAWALAGRLGNPTWGAHFRRLEIDSSWSPRESTGPVDFFRCFSCSLHASASSFPLTSSFQNSPAACLAEWCGFFPESRVIFHRSRRREVGLGRSLRRTRDVLASGYGCDLLHQGRRPAGRTAGGPSRITLPIIPMGAP